MKCHRFKKLLIDKIQKGNENGFILVTALVLLVTLTLVGTTASIITSTDIRIGGNFRKSQEALQVAMAGAEHGREVLRALNQANVAGTGSFSDELAARVGGNAALEGYGSDDVPLVSSAVGDFTYDVFLTNDLAEDPTIQVDNNNRVHITSVATDPINSFNASARVETEVIFVSVDVISALYAKDNIQANGNTYSIDGNDNCAVAAALPPVYNFSIPGDVSIFDAGQNNIEPDPPGAVEGPLNLPLIPYINSLENVAVIILEQDQNNTDFGSSTDYVAVYSDTSNPFNNQGLKIQNGTGYGLLAVDGDLTLGGGFNWYGLILVNGAVTFNGGGGPNQINIYGAVLAQETVTFNGNVDIAYDSCEVSNALLSTGLPVVSWKHSY